MSNVRRNGRRWLAPALALTLTLGLGCAGDAERDREQAFAGRSEVVVRSQLAPGSPAVARLSLGERVWVEGRRRRLVRVRTSSGAEGWVRESELLSEEVRRRASLLKQLAAGRPSQGGVHAFDTLNVHLEPARSSPTVFQMSADERADLLRRRWAEPSSVGERGESWRLLRSETGLVGWALADRLYSGIPVEVAQFAERRRIVAYFALGEVDDPSLGLKKTTWLWTQQDGSGAQHDFDRFRVFRWSPRRGAYQTIGLGKGLRGYLPVEIHSWLESPRGSGEGFSLTLERDGSRVVRTYVVSGNRLQRVSEKPAPPPDEISLPAEVAPPPAPPPPGWLEKLLGWWRMAP